MSASINSVGGGSTSASTRAGAARTGTAGPLSGSGAGGVRPQVQSRRVSLKLGPLGITYSTDQVLWTPEAAVAAAPAAPPTSSASPVDEASQPSAQSSASRGVQAAASATVSSATTTAADAAAGPVDPIAAAEAVEARQYGGAAARRNFHLELAAAWRRELETRARETPAYGPDGAARSTGGTLAAASTGAAPAPAEETPGASAEVPTGSTGAQSAPAAASPTTSGLATSGQAPDNQASGRASAIQPGAASAAFARHAEAPPAALMRRAIGAYLSCARQFTAAGSMLTAVA